MLEIDIQLPELFEQILDEHYYEVVALLILFLTIVVLRLFSNSLPIRKTVKMPAASPATVKLKSTLRLLIPRLRNAQTKDTALSMSSRREMADLLRQNREASARIRTENIIATDVTVELLELLELYAELLLARAGLLDIRDKNIKEGMTDAEGTGLEEAAASIIYAAPRIPRDVRELGLVRSLLIDRFGKEFAQDAQDNKSGLVPKRITDKLSVEPPKPELVQAYLEEIAKTYAVDWPPHREELQQAQNEVDDEDMDDDDEGGAKEQPIPANGAAPSTPRANARDLNLGPLPPTKQPNVEGSKSPVSVAPPKGTSENPSPRVRLPGGGQVKPQEAKKKEVAGGLGAPPTVDDLAKRFSALKR
ncbi:Vacuolar protein sorting-associated protein ist1 [Knufia fluminis]|uniref:Vacuolar protein sorting-associated protein ist1 n=1 Tax=Knufia fluminis TaxID=191047 RepID=A0AAN8FA54_9EURO|nr:Vacuolar protein sorting-associated protein ist1 [Knufia fluminis]